MTCIYHSAPNSIRPEMTEEVILNDDALPGGMKGWRRFRIEYGFECSCPEGTLYIADGPDIYERLDAITALLTGKKSSG